MIGDGSKPQVRMLVCGERLRGDDAAALLATEMLPSEVRALADIVEVGQLSVEALVDVLEGVAVIVADAAVGVQAGEIVTLPLAAIAAGAVGAAAARAAGAAAAAHVGAAPASSHSLPPDQVVALAAELRGSLPRGSFVGIGAVDFTLGAPVSPAVAAALPSFAAALAAEIRRLAVEAE